MANENLNEKKSITFSEIALALANDYDSLYVIDSTDDSYVEYLALGDEKELVKRASGKNFFEDVVYNCRVQVHPEDQEHFLASFKKESVVEILKNGKSFSLNYRLMVDGKPLHYFLKTIRGTDHEVIIGVQNVDEQRRREIQADMERKTFMHISGALASRYETIYYINVDNNFYTQYSSSDEYAKLGTPRHGTDFFADAADDVEKYLHPDDVKRVLYELDKERLLRHLEESGTLALTYRQLLGDRSQYVSMVVVRPKNDPSHIVMGVLNVDAQIRREQSMLEERRIFGEMALALAGRYEVIYHVNIVTDEYSEYSASEKYAKLEMGTKGKDFFGDTQRNMKRDIYPEDLPMMSQLMEKEILLNSLSETGKIVVNYRLMLDGRPQYVSLFAVRPKEESDHVIVGVENIDEAKRKEIEFERAIGSAMDMANKDSLTGIKNKHAYANAEMQLDQQIEDELEGPFAIAVCDVNGLKQVNDLQGHSAGDAFIKSACTIICDTFQHSPVFRIGGDEFVVILKGIDYENRHKLMEEFGEKQRKNLEKGLVTLAYGISDYEPGSDLRVQDVFERADNLMYENKRIIKGEALPRDDAEKNAQKDDFTRFYVLYEQLVSAMTDMEKIDVPRIEGLLVEISKMFRLSKGVTRVYRNPQEEQSGGGETLCCFDTGKEGKEILFLRVVTKVMSSATMTVYMTPDERPLSDEERWKVELVMRTTLSFISRNRLKDMVEELAYHDESGYPNFRLMNNFFMKSVAIGKLFGKAGFHYNLRHFSLINQEFGRETGDVIMRKHFDGLKELISDDGCLIRLGGDNFVGICRTELLDDVKDYLLGAQISFGKGNLVNISARAGAYCFIGDEKNPSDFMGKIITAFRTAQYGGKEQFVFFDEALLMKKEKSMRVQQLFPLALKAEEFHPFYQPKVNIVTGNLEGAEALCRWVRDGKVIPPGEFIPMLEETNDICSLDRYMLEHVCRDIRRWLDEGKEIVRISVNFSRKNIMNVNLPQIITQILDDYRIPHEYVEIELTETTTDVEFSDLKRIARGLHAKGIYTSVDDFGVGFSSLNLIRDIPWNVLKVDRSFLPVEEDGEESIRSIMFRSVVSMAKQLGLECIAEGVETKRQVEVLRENNCELAQGYYFDKPLPAAEFEERLLVRKYKNI